MALKGPILHFLATLFDVNGLALILWSICSKLHVSSPNSKGEIALKGYLTFDLINYIFMQKSGNFEADSNLKHVYTLNH